jgi:hypothetical protein
MPIHVQKSDFAPIFGDLRQYEKLSEIKSLLVGRSAFGRSACSSYALVTTTRTIFFMVIHPLNWNPLLPSFPSSKP